MAKRESYTRSDADELIDRFREACKDLAFKGSQPPEDHDAIDREYEEARKHLKSLLEYDGG